VPFEQACPSTKLNPFKGEKMKRILMSMMAVLIAGTVTMAPAKSKADAANVVNTVLIGAAIVGLVLIEIDEMNRCAAGQLRFCDYYDSRNCQYQEVRRTEIINDCRKNYRWNEYTCVQSSRSSTIYIKSCNGGFDRHYGY
jgi:hypothetical protein